MSRRERIAWIIAGAAVGAAVALVLAVFIVVQTPWFQNRVRRQIVSSVENATGGQAEVGGFAFHWQNLRATIHNFTIHGNEAAGAPPLFHAKTIELGLNLESPFRGMAHIAWMTVDTPEVRLIVYPDGRTNLPAPKTKSTTNPLETIVNLAVGRFEVRKGLVTVADKKIAFGATGEDLRAHFDYDRANAGYRGEIDISPLVLTKDGNPPVRANVSLPVTMRRDMVALNNGQVMTTGSHLTITGRLEHLANPDGGAHIAGRINLGEVKRAFGLQLPATTRGAPTDVDTDLTLVVRKGAIGFENSHLVLGDSTMDLSGMLNEKGPDPVTFHARLNLAQVGNLFGTQSKPRGTLFVNGDFALRSPGYVLHAAAQGKDLSLQQGKTRITGVDLTAKATAVPNRIDVTALNVDAMGGVLTGSAIILNQRSYQLKGMLRHFDLDRVARAFTPAHIGFSGELSGPIEAQGDLRRLADSEVNADLNVSPGRRGIPLSGHVKATYTGRAGAVTLGPSRLTLPHSQVELAGSIGKQIRVKVISRDLRDFRPLIAPPVTLNGGALNLDATVTGSLQAPHIAGQAVITNFLVDQRRFGRLAAAIDAGKSGISIVNANLTRGTLTAHFDANVGLQDWKPLPGEPLQANVIVRNADLADALALAGQGSIPASGALSADAHITGTIGSPVGNVAFTVVNGTLQGTHFDSIRANAILSPQAIDVPTLEYVAGLARLEASGAYQHALNQLNNGTFQARLQGSGLQLTQFQPMVTRVSGLSGILTVQADVAGSVRPSPAGTTVQLTAFNGDLAARGLTAGGRNLGDLTATARTLGQTVNYTVASDFAGSSVRIAGHTALTGRHETAATADISNLPIAPALAAAGETQVPLTGTVSGAAQLNGTLAAPVIQASVDVTNGSAWGEPFRRAQGNFRFTAQLVEVNNARIEKDGSYLTAGGSFAHPAGDYRDGTAQFSVRSNDMPLAQIHTLQRTEPVGGTLALAATGTATLSAGMAPRFTALNANLTASNLTMNGAPLGDLTARAETRSSQILVQLASNLAGSTVRGNATIQAAGEYPISGRVTFTNLTYSHLRPFLGTPPEPLLTSATGDITVAGPLARPETLQGTVEITRLEVRSAPAPTTGTVPRVNVDLRNQGPIRAKLANSVFTIEHFQLAGPYTNLILSGTASLAAPRQLAMRATGNLNLELLEAFNPDVFSSGGVALDAAIRGTLSQPRVAGTLQLKGASVNAVNWPNGLSDANGTITFTRTEAIIQNITGQSGGGKVTASGYVGYGGPEMTVRLDVTGSKVFVNYPQNVTTEVNARLTLTGTTTRSLLSGDVTILDVALHSQTDIGSILSAAATPRPISSPYTGFLANIHFDVRIVTAASAQFRTSLTQNLQADANLTLRGTPDSPGMLGRVVITEGQVVFFGNRYKIQTGTVAFYNPQRINPYVNIDLDTMVSGVEVTISVTGPMERLKLTYRSDPPLAFNDILALLTSGQVNTTDPVLAARQPVVEQQSYQQVGASALLGQAVTNPVAGTLQRLFGVSQLQINPQFVTGYTTPQTTVSLQQQINPDVVFTYMQLVGQTNPQIIRMEWTIDPQWSAVAQRDYNGYFWLDFYYKKRFW
jgi:autotransporter translocation and assembly factor TamB